MTRAAQQHLRHVDFLNTLSTENHLRSENTRIVSDHHRLQTVTTNKFCLSAFDNKRYILPDGIKTLPFGHYAIDEIDWNNDDVEWDYDDFSDLLLSYSPEWDNSFVVPHSSPDTIQSSNTWQPPDPGFVAAQNINDSDIESSDIVDFDASFEENSTPDNPFINFEAEEASESESERSVQNCKAILVCIIKFNCPEREREKRERGRETQN